MQENREQDFKIKATNEYESELKTRIKVTLDAVQYARKCKFEKITIDVDVLSILLENSNL